MKEHHLARLVRLVRPVRPALAAGVGASASTGARSSHPRRPTMIGAGRSPATGAVHPARRAVRTTPRAAMHADTPAATRAEIPIETPIDMSAAAPADIRFDARRAAAPKASNAITTAVAPATAARRRR